MDCSGADVCSKVRSLCPASKFAPKFRPGSAHFRVAAWIPGRVSDRRERSVSGIHAETLKCQRRCKEHGNRMHPARSRRDTGYDASTPARLGRAEGRHYRQAHEAGQPAAFLRGRNYRRALKTGSSVFSRKHKTRTIRIATVIVDEKKITQQVAEAPDKPTASRRKSLSISTKR